jgi:hypothetical protein
MRPDLGVYDRINWSVLSWVSSFRRRQRPRILDRLAAFQGEVVMLRNRREVVRYAVSLASGCSEEGPTRTAPARQAMRVA